MKKDYCGPEGSKIISALVPDEVDGVDLSHCCKRHDDDYRRGGGILARFRYDWRLASCVRCKMKAAGKALRGLLTSSLYLTGVRLGGWACFSWFKEKKGS